MSTNVLIVEDDPVISHDIDIILTKAGFKVIGPAFNAMKAIDLLGSREVDFALLDIHLGKGDTGIDVAKIIHQKHRIPYVFLTSFSDKATLEAAMEQGPYGYLVKPFQEATLLSTMELALYTHRLKDKSTQIDLRLSGLTEQESKICKSLIDGNSYQAVADELFISINTVRYHVKNLYQKYGVNGRAELMAEIFK